MKYYLFFIVAFLAYQFSFAKGIVYPTPSDEVLAVNTIGPKSVSNQDGMFRVYKHFKYTILENKSIVVYEKLLPGNKQTSFKSIPEYFFSVGINGEVKLLTLMNLKDAFRGNYSVLDQIDLYFRSDVELIRYDLYRNTYRVNYVLSKA